MERTRYRLMNKGDTPFYIFVYFMVTGIFLIVLYPLVYILSASFSSPAAVSSGRVILWPVSPSLDGYAAVFANPHIVTGYMNSAIYALLGTLINVVLTIMAAYPLSQDKLRGKRLVVLLIMFTMIFGGGMIPDYLLVQNLGLINTRWAMLLPGAISVYNLLIVRTFFSSSVPKEIYESAKIDGCSDIKYLTRILVPLSKAVISVVLLFYAVDHWNAFFSAFLYLTNKSLFPLQIVLRDILLSHSVDPEMILDPEMAAAKQGLADLLRYSLIVVASLPVILMYPFVQKYFAQGVMLGSVKG